MVLDSLGRSPLNLNNKNNVMEAFCQLLDELDDFIFAVALRVPCDGGSAKNLAVIAVFLLLAPPQASAIPMADASTNPGTLALLGISLIGALLSRRAG